MKEYDRVKLTVEKEKYTIDGAHKGMVGWICDPRNINGQWLVCFDECDLPQFPTIPVKEKDLEVVWELPLMQVGVNVILFTDTYVNIGLPKGLKGTVIDRGAKEGEWLVRFPVQTGIDCEKVCSVDEDYIADLAYVRVANDDV